MAQTQRKFTNGYYPSFESDSDGVGCSDQCKTDSSENMHNYEKEKVAEKLYTLLRKWSKFKQLRKNPENEEQGTLRHILTGN